MKVCKDCKINKDKSLFYATQGECKECTKQRVKKRMELKLSTPEGLEKERKRQREKYYKLDYKEKHKPTKEKKKAIENRYRIKYPEKYAAKSSSQRIKKEGYEAHHWSYNENHYKDIAFLKPKDHFKAHRYLTYDQIAKMYKTLKGDILDTKQKHEDYIYAIIQLPE